MKKFIFIGYFCLLSGVASASCPELYPNNKPIDIPNTIELCNSFYVSLYDPRKRAVRYTSERLVKTDTFGTVKRVDSFRADYRVSNPVSPRDYVGSGYDKGHLAPADDASTSVEMYQSFLMTNMTPQTPELNRGPWKALETKVRKMVTSTPMWVETIPVYPKDPVYVSNIPVPTGYWKVSTDKTKRFFYGLNSTSPYVKEYNSLDIDTLLK